MWGDSDPDPGGGHKPPIKGPSTQELLDLKDQNEQQLVLIAQLKEMLRKEQSSVTQEKVEEYVNTLSRAKAKRSKIRRDDSASSSSGKTTVNIDSAKKEKINLLRQQLEENKAKLAERGKSQKGIEDMITQFQAQLRDSPLNTSTPLNLSLADEKPLEYNKHTSQEELYNILLTKEKRLSELSNKTQKLENTVLDLQENLKEKDSVIDARTKAITLMTDSLNKKGKNTLDALEETKEQMRKMQENFIKIESEMKARQLVLLNDLKMKNFEIGDLQQSNSNLENENYSLQKRIDEFEHSIKDSSVETIPTNKLLVEIEDLKNLNLKYESDISNLEKIVSDKDNVIDGLKKDLNSVTTFNSQNIEKIKGMEEELQSAKTELQRFTNIGLGFKSDSKSESEDIAKLKKQLDESNKNMIKIKANNKSKVKELNKHLEQLRKASDVNALVVQLQKDNSKLIEKVAELEEEIGNLQLKSVESMSTSKESTESNEERKEVDTTMPKLREDLDEKEKIICILESDVLRLKDELDKQSEQLKNLSYLQSENLVAEMSSIDFEEKLEIAETEKKLLVQEKEHFIEEKQQLLEKIDVLQKEKQEINAKLDSYIQENMDLIDKLEKLSAEKVSSVESIEIVEGLTQQEKLELAAYQKNIQTEEDHLKCSEDDNPEGDHTPELNESVLQLNEDTTELLHRIEMFTHERKEVMTKMEDLKEEVNTLTLKLKTVENNRDILAETYEQLQNEKEILQAKLEYQCSSVVNEQYDAIVAEVTNLQTQCNQLRDENDNLKQTLKDYDGIVNEKHEIENNLRIAIEKCTELESKLTNSFEQIHNYQQVLEENKGELITSSNTINQLHLAISAKDDEIQSLNQAINELNELVQDLQNQTQNLEQVEDMQKILEELKSELNTEVKQAEKYEDQLAENSDTITKLNDELIQLNRRLLDYESQLERKNDEVLKYTSEIQSKNEMIKSLQEAIQDKDKNFKTVNEDVREKYLLLQKQLDGSTDSLEKKIEDLTNKNKDQLDKMKKIAANLKKKTQAYQELEEAFGKEKLQWQETLNEKISILSLKNNETNQIIEGKNVQLEHLTEQIKTLNEEVENISQTNVELQNYILQLKANDKQQKETISHQQHSLAVKEDIDNAASITAEEKIADLNAQIEDQQHIIKNLTTRILTLEESKSQIEHEKAVIHGKVVELEEKLKKVLANLKKKTHVYQELQDKYHKEFEKWEFESKEKDLRISEMEKLQLTLLDQVQHMEDKNKMQKDKLEEYDRNVSSLKEHISSLEKSNLDMQNCITELKRQQSEVSLQQELLTSEQNPNNSTANVDTNEKVQELQMVVESMENDIENYKAKISTLQEAQASIQEENSLLKDKNVELEEKLNLTSNSFKEKSLMEDKLELKLAEISANDESLNKKLQDTQRELQDSLQKNQEYEEVIKKFKIKLKKSQDKVNELKSVENNLEHLENINEHLKRQVAALETNQRHIQNENESLQKRNMSDYEKIEADYQIQLEELLRSKNDLTVECEKLKDAIIEMQEREQELLIETTEYKVKLDQIAAEKVAKSTELQNQLDDANNKLVKSEQDMDNLSRCVQELQNELLTSKSRLEAHIEETSKNEIDSVATQTSDNREGVSDVAASQVQENVLTFQWSAHQIPPNDNKVDVCETKDQQFVPQPQIKSINPFSTDTMDRQSPANWFDVLNPEHYQNIPYPNSNNEQQMAVDNISNNPVIETGKEALLNKIKALEFLLYNVDKEKEIALTECTEMFNEFANVIYEKLQYDTSPPIGAINVSDLESQVMSDYDITKASSNKEALQKIEFEDSSIFTGEQSVPVLEDIVQSKETYMCYREEPMETTEKLHEDDECISKKLALESQIVPDAKIGTNKKNLQKLEFETVSTSHGPQEYPVVEPMLQPKQAYVCYNKDESKPHSFEAFGENDDGWAWGPEEAKLEEEHLQTSTNSPQLENFKREIETLREEVMALRTDRNNHLEEIKQLQVKSGKLIKKCKELKSKNEELIKKPRKEDDFFDLNETIQEELKLQVEKLQKELRYVTSELDREKNEKCNALMKVESLTATNEKMLQTKEIQDANICMWQRKHDEAFEKLQQYEWGNDGFNNDSKQNADVKSATLSDDKKLKELEHTIQELAVDNEELQSLLEEQTKLRLDAEKAVLVNNDLALLQDRFEEKCKELYEKESLLQRQSDQLEKYVIENKILIENTEESQRKVLEKTEELQKLEIDAQNQNLQVSNSAEILLKKIENLENQLESTKQENNTLQNSLSERDAVIDDLQTTFEQFSSKKVDLEKQVKELMILSNDQKNHIEIIENEIEAKTQQIQHLENQLQLNTQYAADIEKLKGKANELENEIHEKDSNITQLTVRIEESRNNRIILEKELFELKESISHKNEEIKKYVDEIETLNQSILNLQLSQQNIGLNQNEMAQLQETLLKYETLNEKCNDEIRELKEDIQKLQLTLQNKDAEFNEKTNALLSELAEKWQAAVDQRGDDVSHSWKLHLESVESEYTTIQQKLKDQLLELQEKCNILANENSELRKTADTDIRQEVDRISALQQQFNNSQQTIAELERTLKEKDIELIDLKNKLDQIDYLYQENENLKSQLNEKELKLSSINIIVETTQKQFDEKREAVEEIVRILEKNAVSPLTYEKQDVVNEIQRQLNFIDTKNKEIATLKKTVDNLNNRLVEVTDKDQEIVRLNDLIISLQSQLAIVLQQNDEYTRLIQELQDKTINLEVVHQELVKIKQEHSNCNIIIEDFKQKLEEYRMSHMSLQQELNHKQGQITELSGKLQQAEYHCNNSNKDTEGLHNEIAQLKQDCQLLQQNLSEVQSEFFGVSQQLTEKSNNLETVTEQLNYSQQNYQITEAELSKIKQQLQENEREYYNSIQQAQQIQLHNQQTHEEILQSKDYEIQRLESQLEVISSDNKIKNDNLTFELKVKEELESKIEEQSALIEEENKQLTDLRWLIEDQVMKIEELKKELFDKSNQYDSIIAEMDISRQAVTQQPSSAQVSSFSPVVSEPATKVMPRLGESSDLASRAELDIALYMLHQRDVRCEELTVELTQLLEERDTLQLRLSNAIREKEELRRRNTTRNETDVTVSSGSGDTTPSRSKSSAIFLAASGTELASEPPEMSSSDYGLATKLSELKNVGYRRDKTFVDEQESRRMQQLAIMQQHINEAAKLPPEAAAKLVDASYTLSRDVQSPSKVLLDWLWGRSTPKVNDT